MSVLGRYVSRHILVRLLVILFLIVAFEVSFDLVDRADRVLAAYPGDPGALARYVALRVPGLLADLIPIAALLGALLGIGDLLRNRELVASWTMGVSPTMLMRRLVPLALALAVAQVVLGEAVLPPASRALAAMGFADSRQGVLTASAEGAVWIRDGPDIVRAIPANAREAEKAISIFRLDRDGLLVERLDARWAVPADGGGWILQDVVRRAVGAPEVEHADELPYWGTLNLGHLDLLATDARDLPLRDLLRVLASGATGSRPMSLYLTWTIYRVVSPLAPALMIMLAVALAQHFERTGGMTRLLVRGGSIGFAYLILDQTAVALGEVDTIPPWIAAPGTSVALAGLIAWLVVRRRGRVQDVRHHGAAAAAA